jgi:ATP synthase protein I
VPEKRSTKDRQAEAEERLVEKVATKATRKLKAKGQEHKRIWFGLGMMGLVGWAVALPTLAGIALGVWLDSMFPGRVSWTLTFLFIGVVLGCLNAWFWVKRESGTNEDD